MSFVFSWDKLDDEVALQIEGMIHAHFQRITKPTFMGNIAVSKFRLGSTPPSITVLDITDPLEEWYVHMDQEEARLAQEAADAGGGESMDEDDLASGEDDDDDDDGRFPDEYSYSPDGSIVMVGEGDDMEYLENTPFEEEERIETESWLRRQQRRELNESTSTSSDSFKDEIQKVFMAGGISGPGSAASKATSSRGRSAFAAGEGSDLDSGPTIDSALHHFKSAMASPTKTSPSSTTSSSSSATSDDRPPYRTSSPAPKMHLQEKARPSLSVAQPRVPESKLQNRKPHLDIDTKTASPRAFPTLSSPYNAFLGRPAVPKSLSSHASDDEIESEAFYTQGESTIYQQLKNLALESGTLHTPNSAFPERIPLESALSPSEGGPSTTQSQPNNSFFPSTPGGISGNNNSTQGSFGLGFGAGLGSGLGSSPGSVLSSVMQSRAANRPLSSASFYSTPQAPVVGTAPPQTPSGQAAPFHLSEISGMASGNSMLGLGRMQLGSMYSSRAGTPSRTIPSTPRGFESPVLANSRRQSFSDSTGDDMNATKSVLSALGKSTQEHLHLQHHSPLDHHDSAYTSPVEALSFDALRQPKSATSSQMDRHLPSSVGQRSATRDKRVPQGYRRGSSSGRRRRRASSPPRPTLPKRHENDIQLLMDVSYQGQMGFTVETELLLNYPTFAFLALPVKLVITGFSFRAKVLMGYLRDHVNVCFLEPEDPSESILSNVRIESQVGDEQKQAVLKNVGKIERFVVEQLRKFITEDFVYPSYHSVELLRTPPVATTATATPSSTVSGSETLSKSQSPSGMSVGSTGAATTLAPSTTAGSSTSASIHTENQHVLHRRAGEGRVGGEGSSGIPSRGSASSSATNTSRSAPSRSPRPLATASSTASRQSTRYS
ncbi:mitochondrial distribution and morphology protein 12 [Entomortierella parvispora]|uniref:Mitochondrial distribution and morphology protein 12 n=1 Tax=Entomortierella parvispora TaxID=205924 RepID=A0A9P3M1M7_9FUNG|nr:mitochondrial distribution and morphology protein 12 [Entomortierella parvispora]